MRRPGGDRFEVVIPARAFAEDMIGRFVIRS